MAAALELNVPRFRRFLVFGLIFREYNRYSPDFSLRIITFIFIIQYNKNAWAMNETTPCTLMPAAPPINILLPPTKSRYDHVVILTFIELQLRHDITPGIVGE
jgi:hypothetical protein